jgi:N-acetyl-alpha-D-muramate 1-phosphate uridylyltransferase
MTTPVRPVAPRRAMVLAAGVGVRMRPLTDRMPKPLIRVGGKALIDHTLDRLVAAGVSTAVINVHHFAEQLRQHLAKRQDLEIIISDESRQLLGTGGGVQKALPVLGEGPFFHVNSDTIWIEGVTPNLDRIAAAFDSDRMEAVLLLAPTTASIGYEGRGDFALSSDGRLRPRAERQVVPFVYAGAAILTPSLFVDAPSAPFPLLDLFNRAAQAGRLHGVRLDGLWMHIGTPEAIAKAEAAIVVSAA